MGVGTIDRRASLPRGTDALAPVGLLALAALGWWWSAHMSGMPGMSGSGSMAGGSGAGGPGSMTGMTGAATQATGMAAAGSGMAAMVRPLALVSFVVAWVAMMAAMMLPAVTPVVRLYGLAAARGRVAPLPFFVAGYLLVWALPGIPAYWAWRALSHPLSMGESWVGRLAGGTLVLAAVWQVTPLKTACLRQCRSPMSVFLRAGARAERPAGALRLGAGHGLYCLGCCWAFFALLVAVGTMNLAWMVGLTALIFAEKVLPFGTRIAYAATPALAGLGILLLVHPHSIVNLT